MLTRDVLIAEKICSTDGPNSKMGGEGEENLQYFDSGVVDESSSVALLSPEIDRETLLV